MSEYDNPVTPEDIVAWRALEHDATLGPWKVCGAEGCPRQDIWSTSIDVEVAAASERNECGEGLSREAQQQNARFIAAARTALPRLMDALEEARRQLASEHESKRAAIRMQHDLIRERDAAVNAIAAKGAP